MLTSKQTGSGWSNIGLVRTCCVVVVIMKTTSARITMIRTGLAGCIEVVEFLEVGRMVAC